MSVNQFIMLLCFYIIGLTGCNKIGNHSYMHSDACNDDIASLNKLDKLLEEIQNEQPEEIQNSEGSNDDIANLNKLDKLLEKIQNEQPEKIQNETSSIQPTRKQRKACAITSDLELKILNIVLKKPKWGCTKISDIIFKKTYIYINPNTISNFLVRCNLGNKNERCQPTNQEKLKEMIKGYEAKNQTIAHGSKSTGNQNNTNPQLELKILREAYADPTLGHIAISNKIYEETGQHISDLVIRKFFSESNLQNREKRYQAYDDGTLLKMIEETQAKIQAEKNQMSAQTN